MDDTRSGTRHVIHLLRVAEGDPTQCSGTSWTRAKVGVRPRPKVLRGRPVLPLMSRGTSLPRQYPPDTQGHLSGWGFISFTHRLGSEEGWVSSRVPVLVRSISSVGEGLRRKPAVRGGDLGPRLPSCGQRGPGDRTTGVDPSRVRVSGGHPAPS